MTRPQPAHVCRTGTPARRWCQHPDGRHPTGTRYERPLNILALHAAVLATLGVTASLRPATTRRRRAT